MRPISNPRQTRACCLLSFPRFEFRTGGRRPSKLCAKFQEFQAGDAPSVVADWQRVTMVMYPPFQIAALQPLCRYFKWCFAPAKWISLTLRVIQIRLEINYRGRHIKLGNREPELGARLL